jgi:hypothetical protein
MSRIHILRALALLALLAACDILNPVGTCACDPVPLHTIVYGQVSAPSGAPVPDATVLVEVGPAGCTSFVLGGAVQTSTAGAYRILATGNSPGTDQCVRLSARAPTGSGLADSEPVQFTIPPIRTPADSVRRDIALRTP